MGVKYIKCDCCGKKIFFGDVIYFHHAHWGIYCSAECYAKIEGVSDELDEILARNNDCEVFDDEQRKKSELETLQ